VVILRTPNRSLGARLCLGLGITGLVGANRLDGLEEIVRGQTQGILIHSILGQKELAVLGKTLQIGTRKAGRPVGQASSIHCACRLRQEAQVGLQKRQAGRGIR
jgi:hypothetical protein